MSGMASLRPYLSLIRPRQWLKNTFIFLPALFGGDLADPRRWMQSLLAFLFFSLNASAVYAFNDVLDAAEDRLHPAKRQRPVAAGRLSGRAALGLAALLLTAALSGAFSLRRELGWVLGAYTALNLGYTAGLKRVVILDVMIIAFGFILRLLAGAAVCTVAPSHWIVLTTFFLALFLGFAKRRCELVNEAASGSRSVLKEYTPALLHHLLASLMGITILCYSLYAISTLTISRFGGEKMAWTIPFVVFGLFRYYQQLHLKNSGESPTDVLLHDRATLVNLLLWGAACSLIIYR